MKEVDNSYLSNVQGSKKISKDTELNKNIYQLVQTDLHRNLHSAAKYAFFSTVHGTFTPKKPTSSCDSVFKPKCSILIEKVLVRWTTISDDEYSQIGIIVLRALEPSTLPLISRWYIIIKANLVILQISNSKQA